MNQIARYSASGAVAIPPALPEPPLPVPVADLLTATALHAERRAAYAAASGAEREGMFVGSPPKPPVLRGRDRADAERAAEHLHRQVDTVPFATFRAWLGPVNAAVRNPQGAEDFEVRCAGLHAMLDDLPIGAFTAEARRRLPAFFPSAEDIRNAVEPGARRLRTMADALRASLNAKPAEPEPEAPPLSPEERAAIVAKARARIAELRTTGNATRPERVTARPLSPVDLAERYRVLAAEGSAAAAARLRALEPSA